MTYRKRKDSDTRQSCRNCGKPTTGPLCDECKALDDESDDVEQQTKEKDGTCLPKGKEKDGTCQK